MNMTVVGELADTPPSIPDSPAEQHEPPPPPANVRKKILLKWNVDLNVLLLRVYLRYVKKDITRDQVRDEFAKVARLQKVPQLETLMNNVSKLKRLCIDASDIREDIGRLTRTTTEAERHKELLSSKQQDLRRILDELGVQPGDTAMEHEIHKLGTDLKLDMTLSQSKQSLDAEKAALKKKGDEMATKILQNPEHARQVRAARRQRKQARSEREDDEQNESDEGSVEQSCRHPKAYCDPDDPAWSSRRKRSEVAANMTILGGVGGSLTDSFEDVKGQLLQSLEREREQARQESAAVNKRLHKMETILARLAERLLPPETDEKVDGKVREIDDVI